MEEEGDNLEMEAIGDDELNNEDDNFDNITIDNSFIPKEKLYNKIFKKRAKNYKWKKHDYDSNDDEETSFGGGVVNLKNKKINNLKSRFPDVEYKKLDIVEGDDGSLGVREKLTNKFTMIINGAGEISTRISSRLRKLLGESFNTKLERNARLNEEATRRINILRQENEEDKNSYDQLHDEETDNLDYVYRRGNEIQKRLVSRVGQIARIQNEIDERDKKDKNIIDQLPTRERVKQIFKKYGLTIASIMLAIWAVVATIMGVTQSGKEIVKKEGIKVITIPSIQLNKSIPTAPIINFIFDVALEVIEDLVENSFLLIELLVIFYIDKR